VLKSFVLYRLRLLLPPKKAGNEADLMLWPHPPSVLGPLLPRATVRIRGVVMQNQRL
jgi:hypothetical protein